MISWDILLKKFQNDWKSNSSRKMIILFHSKTSYFFLYQNFFHIAGMTKLGTKLNKKNVGNLERIIKWFLIESYGFLYGKICGKKYIAIKSWHECKCNK